MPILEERKTQRLGPIDKESATETILTSRHPMAPAISANEHGTIPCKALRGRLTTVLAIVHDTCPFRESMIVAARDIFCRASKPSSNRARSDLPCACGDSGRSRSRPGAFAIRQRRGQCSSELAELSSRQRRTPSTETPTSTCGSPLHVTFRHTNLDMALYKFEVKEGQRL
jgi:hypothetical protein